MDDIETLREKLTELQREHQDLNDVIDRLVTHQPVDFLQLQRLKKRKLVLKDTIQKIESQLVPDIIA
ncbi:MAG: YdcH family protein [Micavibrio sp.]